MEPKDILTLGMSVLALLVSTAVAVQTFKFGREKAARDLWQRILELYLAHPVHVLGKPVDESEAAVQAYRTHVALIFLALEELIKAFPRDKGWMSLVQRHVDRHANYVRELRADPGRLQMYSDDLRDRMMKVS